MTVGRVVNCGRIGWGWGVLGWWCNLEVLTVVVMNCGGCDDEMFALEAPDLLNYGAIGNDRDEARFSHVIRALRSITRPVYRWRDHIHRDLVYVVMQEVPLYARRTVLEHQIFAAHRYMLITDFMRWYFRRAPQPWILLRVEFEEDAWPTSSDRLLRSNVILQFTRVPPHYTPERVADMFPRPGEELGYVPTEWTARGDAFVRRLAAGDENLSWAQAQGG